VPSLTLRGVAAALVACAALSSTSCAKSGPKLYPVRGKVLYLDKAPEGATVVFQLTGNAPDAPKPTGVVAADGTFSLKTHPHGEGAPAGEYGVLITWLPPDARSAWDNVVNKLPARYADPTSPRLKATVKEGSNDLETFKLTR
jgi:hypothetical protein